MFSNSHRAVLSAGALIITVLSLSSCFAGPPAVETDPVTGVGFDDVQSATIQLEARGTFIDPSYGGYEGAGRGSGFLIDDTGLAITNNHVVVGAGTLDVWIGGDQSRTLNAKVLGSSECLDIAVVQLEGGGYPFLGWREGDIETGTEVYSAGFPLGDPEFTLTRGIVSKDSAQGETSWASVGSVIEHDARTRPGNSGGPLVDTDGKVVGVNYAGENQFDYNYAIHRDEVLTVLDQLIAGENVLSLGINAQSLTNDEGVGLGIWVASVAAGSIADKAGVEPGDLLTRMQGVSLGVNGTLSEYCDVLRTHGQDATLDVELYRPETGLYYRGQFNGDAIEKVSVLGGGGTSGVFVTAHDDLGVISVEIPDAWTDVDGAPFTDSSGFNWASIEASPDLDGYYSSWNTPGVTILASQDAVATADVSALMADSVGGLEESGCQMDDADTYDDGYHQGLYSYWTGCGTAGASYVVVVGISTEQDYVILVAVQANSDDDLDAIDRVLGSFIAEF